MAKSSFVKPGSATSTAAPQRPAPARPAPTQTAAPARPQPAARPAPTQAARPAPARPAPVAPAQPPVAQRPAPRPAPAARPTPIPPAGVNTNVGQPDPARRPAPRAAQPPPEPPVEEQQEELQEEAAELEVLPGDAADQEVSEQVALIEGPADIGNLMTAPLGGIQGQLDQSDFDIPRLGLCQSVGPLYEDHGFTPGDWVAGQSVILWQDGCEEIEITVLKVLKQWVENLPYGSDEMPRVYNSPQEAVAAGLQLTDWDRDDAALPQANAMVLVKKNEGIVDENGLFNLEGPDGALYALLLWRISGTAYGRVMKKLTGALRQRLRGGLHTGSFKLSAKKEKGKINTYWVPVLDPGDAHDEAMANFILENAGDAAE